MIGKSGTGGGFKGLINYVTSKQDAEIIDQQNLFGDIKGWAAQMRNVAESRNLKKPVFHASLSLPKNERGTTEQWQKAGKAYLTKMGFDTTKTQYSIVRHKDTEHDHVHIIVNRVQLDNKVVNDFQHKKRTHEATRTAELAGGFKVVQQKMTHGKANDLRNKIDESLRISGGNFGRFKRELETRGITLQTNTSKSTGYVSGISYKTDDRTLKGSELGKNYSLGGLKNRSLEMSSDAKISSNLTSATQVVSPIANGDGSMLGGELKGPRDMQSGQLTDSERRKRQRDNGFEL